MKLCPLYYSDPHHDHWKCETCSYLTRQIREQIAGHEAMVIKLQQRLLNAYFRPGDSK